VVTATIPGADPKLKEEEIAFSCHLDHQRPGANDNASGVRDDSGGGADAAEVDQ